MTSSAEDAKGSAKVSTASFRLRFVVSGDPGGTTDGFEQGFRCDSATYLGSKGACIFDQVTARFQLRRDDKAVAGVAAHIWLVFHSPEKVYPAPAGPDPRQRPLHRRGHVGMPPAEEPAPSDLVVELLVDAGAGSFELVADEDDALAEDWAGIPGPVRVAQNRVSVDCASRIGGPTVYLATYQSGPPGPVASPAGGVVVAGSAAGRVLHRPRPGVDHVRRARR